MAAQSRWAFSYGHLDVVVAVLSLPSAVVSAQLQPGVSLAAQTLTPPGTHPLLLMFGQHSHVRPFFLPKGLGGSYHEWIVATPFVEWTDAAGQTTPWAAMSRLYLDSALFTVLGWLYAYPKVLARIAAPDHCYNVRTFMNSNPRVSMEWHSAGPVMPWSSFADAPRVAPIFGQPFIERLSIFPWLGSRMWFELDQATVEPVTLHATVEAGCAPGLSALNISMGRITDGVPGAFRLSLDWMLSRPYLGGHLPAVLRAAMPPDCSQTL